MDTSTTPKRGFSAQKKQFYKVVEEYRDILSSPIEIPLNFQVNHSIDMTSRAPLPNGAIYYCSLLENEEIKQQI